MTSSEISQIKKLESVKYLDIASKNDLGNDLNLTLLVTSRQNAKIPIWPNQSKLNCIRSILMKRK